MKKYFLMFIIAACSVFGITSCLDGVGSEATVQYFVNCDSIAYENTNDAEYDSIIKNALQELKFSYYVFSINATSDESVIDYAVNKCNVSANETFKANVKKGITLAEIENQLYKSNSNYFVSKGINSAPAIGLSPMKIYLSLLGTYSGPVFYVNRDSCNVKR